MKSKLLLFFLSIFLLSLFGATFVFAEEDVEYINSDDVVPIEINIESTDEGSFQITWDDPEESDFSHFELLKSETSSYPEKSNSTVLLQGTDEREYEDAYSVDHSVKYYRMCVYTILSTMNCGETVAVDGRTGLVLDPQNDAFTDVENHWALEYIEKLRYLNVIQGRGDGLFAPNQNILRAEAIKIFMLAFGIGGISCHSEYFPDLSPTDWYCDVVSKAYQDGYIVGDDGLLYPDREITRAEAVKIVLEIKGIAIPEIEENPFDDVDKGQWYAKYIAQAKALNIVQGTGDNMFEPNRPITRAELSKIAAEAAGL